MRAYLAVLAFASGLMLLWAALVGIQSAASGVSVWASLG